jgi:iron only hydrogenase large subunit-like protein
LRELGFARVVEAAAGADQTARLESEELAQRLAAGGGFMATSCCPAWKAASRLAGKGIASRISETPSPMSLGAKSLVREEPGALVVFVGPCTAKRREAADDANVDIVLTAEELGALLVAAGIDVAAAEPESTVASTAAKPSAEGRLFAVSGGVAEAVKAASRAAGRPEPRVLAVNGLSKQALRQIALWESAPPDADLVEVMACEGGCVAGPCALANPKVAASQLVAFARE